MDRKQDNRPNAAATPPSAGERNLRRGNASRPARRAQKDRGAETRAQLISAALEAFGRLGFEGAGTREIAKAANANLAAIVYHFGGKEALHIAVAEHVVESISAKIRPSLLAAGDASAVATPGAARSALAALVETFIDVILGSAEAELWARFIVREQMQPTAAFDVIYRFLGGAVTTLTRLIATAVGRPEDDEMRTRAFTILGQVLVFRVAQAAAVREMKWSSIGDPERALIKRVVVENITAILDGNAG